MILTMKIPISITNKICKKKGNTSTLNLKPCFHSH